MNLVIHKLCSNWETQSFYVCSPRTPLAKETGVAEMVEIGSSNPGRVKPMTYKIYIYRFQTRYSTLIGYCKDWSVQCEDNVSEWGYQVMGPGSLHHKVTMNIHCHMSVPILI